MCVGGRGGRVWWWWLVVVDGWVGAPQCPLTTAYEGKRMFGGIGHVLLSRPILKLIMVKIHWFLSVNLSSK